MTLDTKKYVSPFQFDLLKKFKQGDTLKKKYLTTKLWLTAQQAKELGYNQGESDFELIPGEISQEVNQFEGKLPQPTIETPEGLALKQPLIVPEAGGNIRNLLLRLYSEKIPGALARGTKVEGLQDYFLNDIQNQLQTNPEQFFQQLASKRLPTETRALLNYLNVPTDITDQIVGVQDTEIQVFQTLNRIPEFSGIDVEGLTNLIETNPQQVMSMITTGGITPAKRDLMRLLGFTETEIQTIIRTPLPVGAALDKGQLAIEAEAGEAATRAGKPFSRLFTAGVGDLVANVGGVFRWAGAEGIGDKITQAGQFMQVQAQPMEKGEFKWQDLFDPTSYSFQSTLKSIIRTTPTLMAMALPGIGAYGLAGAITLRLGLGTFSRAIITGIGGSALSRPLESAMEAAQSYDEARARGLSHEEATKVANTVFEKNLTLVGTDIIQLTAAFAPTPFGSAGSIIRRGLVKTAQVGGKLTITGLTEGGEEVYQDLLQRQARGEKFKMDADAQQVFAIGAVMGLGMGGGGDILMRVTDKVATGFTPGQKAQFDTEVKANQAKGLDETQAKVQAMDKVVESNPDVVKKVETATQEVNQELTQEQLDKIQAKPAPTATTEGVVKAGVTPAPEVTIPPEARRYGVSITQGRVEITRSGFDPDIPSGTMPPTIYKLNEAESAKFNELEKLPNRERKPAQDALIEEILAREKLLGRGIPKAEAGMPEAGKIIPEKGIVSDEIITQEAEPFQEAVSHGIPPSKAPPPAAQTITTPTSIPEPARDSEIRRIITQSEEQVRQDQPRAITNLLRKVPGVKQMLEFERPGLKMTAEKQKVLTAMVAEQAARSDVSVWAMGTRLKVLSDIREVFGKDVLRGAKSDIKFLGTAEQAKNPITGTLLDIAQNPELYDLSERQLTSLVRINIHNDQMLDWVTSNYGAEIGHFTPKADGSFLPNVDVGDDVVEWLGSETRAVSQGRGKTRIWDTARDRMGGKTPFDPELDVQKLLEGLDNFKANAAAGQTYKTAIGGLTKLEAMETTHPELFAKMTALRKELNSLKGSASTIESNVHTVIDDFLKSPVEDADLLNFKDALDVRLKAGKRKGLDMTDIQDKITAVQDQIDEIRPAWQAANLKPYTFIQEGLYRYFPQDQAKLILESRAVTNNRLLGFIEKWRGQAFSGDFSPFTIQGVVGVLADPWGSLKVGIGGVKAAIQHRDFLRSVRIEALADDIANNPTEWGEFASLMGRTLTGVPREYAAGFLSKIPGFDKFTENTYVTVTRGSFNLWQRTYKNMVKHGIPELEAKVAASDVASKVYPLVSQTRLGQSQARHAVLRALPTSYSFIRQPATLTADALRGMAKMATRQTLTPSEALAVKVAITGAASTLAVSATSAFVSAKAMGKSDDEAWQAALDAINPNPYNPRFASLIIGNIRIPLGGPYRALFRAMYPAEVKGVPFPVPFAGLPNYLKNRITPALRTQLDLLVNRDYSRQQIVKGTFPGNILRFLEYEFENFLPLTAGTVAESIRQGDKYKEPLWQQVLGQFLGTNPVTLDNTYIDRQIKQLGLEKQGEAKPYTIQKPEVYNTKDLYGDVSSVLKKRTGEGFKDKPLTLAIKSAMDVKDTSDSYLNAKLTSLSDDQWDLLQQRQDLTDTTEFDKTNPLLSKISQRDYLLLREYKSLTDKKAQAQFLKDHPELSLNPRQDWLRSHPKENAQLALFGQAKVLTKEAYNEVLRLAKELDIPDSAIPDLNIPKDSVDNYFKYQDMVAEDKNSSWEAQLMLAKDTNLRDFLGLKPSDTPIASLELKVKNRANFDKLAGFSDKDSSDYIADEKARAEVIKKFKTDNPEFVDDTRRIEAIEKGTNDNPIDEKLVNSHVEYGKLIDQEGIGSSSAETMLFRVDNPEYDQWRQDTNIWGDSALKPIDQTKIPIWRIDVKYTKEDAEYDALPSEGTRRADYLATHDDYRQDKRRREAYQKGLYAGHIESYVSYYELPATGYRRDRFLLNNPDFAKTVGLTVQIRVPSEEYDNLLEKTDRILEDDLRMDAYKLYVPDNLIEHYVLYKQLPSGQYEKDWFMMENQDFYQQVYLGILENERLDFRKTPTREVYAKYLLYQDMPSRMKENYRFDNLDLEDWLILTGKVSERVSETRRKAALTSREKFNELVYESQSEFEEKMAGLRK